MTFQARLEVALQMLAATGLRRISYAPPFYRLLWRAGVPIPPPPFAGPAVNLLFSAFWFGGLWGIGMWLVLWRHQGLASSEAIAASIVAGLLFGAAMAAYWWYKAQAQASVVVGSRSAAPTRFAP